MEKLKELSVFFPAYNLENFISKTVDNAYNVVPKLSDKYEITVINDGSKDETGKVLLNLKKKYKNLKIINHEVNKGYGAALKSGFYSARFNWIAFTDGDGQFDISELNKLISKQKETGADIVIGYYIKRQVGAFTVLTSKIWETLVYIMFGLKVTDIDCGFKLLNRKVFEQIDRLESERGAFISSELLIKARKKRFKIVEVGVNHYPRSEDRKSATGRSLKVIIGSFRDLFSLWKKLR